MNPHDESDQSPSRRVSLRDIAAELCISHVTVSKALRNAPGVADATKKRVRKKADEMGYVPDPLLATLSSYRSDSKTKPIQHVLAWLNAWEEPERLRHHKEFDLYWHGATFGARRLGYRLEEFKLAEIPARRLESIFKTRNIQGILIPPLRGPLLGDLEHFDWSSFAVVRFGYTVPYPPAHFVTSAQMMNTIISFNRALELGYKRIGFICEYWDIRFFGVGYTWVQKKLPKDQQLPPLLMNPTDAFEDQQSMVDTWIKQNRPDAILTDKSEILPMLKNLGIRIPEDIGIATTSIDDTPFDTGIDQKPYEIGRAAIRILTSLIADHSFGMPPSLNETLIEGQWIDGTMMPQRK
jgi:DNA-binding LacI/PurR family transcriptional regulator